MIIDTLANAGKYGPLGERILLAFRFLEQTDLHGTEPGTYEIEGRTVFAMVQDYVTKPPEQGKLEVHRKYIDLQYLARGTERIGYAPLHRLAPGTYDEERDVMFLEGSGELLTLEEGTFMLLFPHDAHAPCIAAGAPAPVRKVVVKIAAE